VLDRAIARPAPARDATTAEERERVPAVAALEIAPIAAATGSAAIAAERVTACT